MSELLLDDTFICRHHKWLTGLACFWVLRPHVACVKIYESQLQLYWCVGVTSFRRLRLSELKWTVSYACWVWMTACLLGFQVHCTCITHNHYQVSSKMFRYYELSQQSSWLFSPFSTFDCILVVLSVTVRVRRFSWYHVIQLHLNTFECDCRNIYLSTSPITWLPPITHAIAQTT